MRLTAYEQGELLVGARPAAGQSAVVLSQSQAESLVQLAERMDARVISWTGPDRVRLHQFVGVLRTGDLELEILPKLDGLPDAVHIRRNLLAMLARTLDLDVQGSEMAEFLRSAEPFICAFARLYCRRLLEALRGGLRQEYVLHADVLPSVRGKIDWAAQARSQAKLSVDFNCVFDERSEDTLLNRALKGALVCSGRLLEGSRDASVVTELRHAMSGVSDLRPAPDQLQRLRTDRTSRRLEPLLTLARLILGNNNPDLGRSALGSHRTYALVWDMNVLFEEYVGRMVRDALTTDGLGVDLQEDGSAYLARDVVAERNAFLLIPDILVRVGQKARMVADTKWKRLARRVECLGVSGPDVYQLLAYAHRYDVADAILVYPHHHAVGTPGVQKEFLTQGDGTKQITVRVVTVDLSRLESVPGQLRAAFLSKGLAAA